MYINYVNDRQELGFSCIKDIEAAKSVAYLNKKGSRSFIVAGFIFFKSSYIEPTVDCRLSISQVYHVIKLDTSRLLTSPSHIQDYILKLRGGSDELSSEEQEKLVKSILAKTPESDYSEISINKFLKKILKLIDPVISDQRFWRVLSEYGKPIKSELPDLSEVRSTNILGTAQNVHPKSKSSSSFFAEALSISDTRKLSPMQKRVQLKMAQNNFSNNLESSGLSRNHEQLSKDIQSTEKLTKLRRSQPLYPSQALGDSYKYAGKQLERKAPRHLQDFGISTEGKTVEEMAIEYKDLLETILAKPNLVICEEGTLNKQEPTINIGDPETRGIVSFENNSLYEDHHFISGYPISEEAFEVFKETGNIGLSPAERKSKIDTFQKKQAQAEREKTTAGSFYSSLPEDARIGNQQLREVEAIQKRLKEDPKSPLTEKERSLIQRADRYQQYRNKFY